MEIIERRARISLGVPLEIAGPTKQESPMLITRSGSFAYDCGVDL